MFSIRLLPDSALSPDGQRLGAITIEDFTETFACYANDSNYNEMEKTWRNELKKIVGGVAAVALVHDPRFAWIVYREGKDCFIQQRLAINGQFHPVSPRCTTTDEGNRISEWATSISAIQQFLVS